MIQSTDSMACEPRMPIIETSPHAASGFVTCARNGRICWRGTIESLPNDTTFDAIYCHDDDAERLLRTLDRLEHTRKR